MPEALVAVRDLIPCPIVPPPDDRRDSSNLRAGAAACLLASIGFLIIGCSGDEPAAPARPLKIAADERLTTLLPALIAEYHRIAPAVDARVTYGPSGDLDQLLKTAGPFDAVLSDRATLDRLDGAGALDSDPGTRFASDRPVLVLRRAREGKALSLADLDTVDVARIALPDPATDAFGRAVQDGLQRAGLWGPLRPKLALGGTVREVWEQARSGQAPAAVVARSLVGDAPGATIVEFEEEDIEPIAWLGRVARRSTIKGQAIQFVRFLEWNANRPILAAHGFGPPDARGGGPGAQPTP